MTYVGITPAGGSILLPQPVSMRLNQAEDAPADGFSGVFPLQKSSGALTGLHIYDSNQNLCFDGIVDEQKESSGSEIQLALAARSRAALLLDNEAVPQTYCMPSLSTIFTRHVKPYGFSGLIGNTRTFSGELTVTKGMSEWEVAQAFCTGFLRVTPRIADGVFDASGERPQGKLVFGTGGLKYSSVAVQNKYCFLISELLMQPGGSGAYSSLIQDRDAAAFGVRHRRCLAAGTDADAFLRAAHRKAFAVTVTCPGEIPARLLMAASLQDKVLGAMDELYVSEIDYTLDSGGAFTRFTLRRWE
jgi:hypothetical protein